MTRIEIWNNASGLIIFQPTLIKADKINELQWNRIYFLNHISTFFLLKTQLSSWWRWWWLQNRLEQTKEDQPNRMGIKVCAFSTWASVWKLQIPRTLLVKNTAREGGGRERERWNKDNSRGINRQLQHSRISDLQYWMWKEHFTLHLVHLFSNLKLALMYVGQTKKSVLCVRATLGAWLEPQTIGAN